jgi:natural product biosynthesis luciferase-like monooxygenase protein
MEFAVFALPTYYADRDGDQRTFMHRTIDFLVLAEALGFDSVWANEHHFHPFGGMIPAPAVMLAALSQRTSRVRLGTSVAVLPLHNPLEIAEQFAMVDLMSGGRLEFGAGRGFVAYDFEVHGVPIEEGQDRMLESLDIIVKAWSGEKFSHHGKFFHYEGVEIWPRPAQRPHPPVWIAATANPSSFETVGRRGHDLLSVAYLRPMEDLGRLTKIYRDARAAAGFDMPSTRIATHYQVVISEDRAEARQLAHDALVRYMQLSIIAQSNAKSFVIRPESRALAERGEGVDIDKLVAEGRVLAGTPDDVVAILERARTEIGLTSVDCTFTFGGLTQEQAERSMRLMAAEVFPRLRQPTAAASATP